MNLRPLEDLASEWRSEAVLFKRRGMEESARQAESYAAELEGRLREWAGEMLTLAEAVEESGFSRSTLERRIDSGELPNVGEVGGTQGPEDRPSAQGWLPGLPHRQWSPRSCLGDPGTKGFNMTLAFPPVHYHIGNMTKESRTAAVREAIKRSPLSIRALARAAGVSHVTLLKIRDGEFAASEDLVRRLLDAVEGWSADLDGTARRLRDTLESGTRDEGGES